MNKVTASLFRLLLIALMLALVSGCTTMKLPPYQAKPVDSYPNQQANGGLVLAIHPLLDKAESRKYFGTDLLGNHVLAVLVVAENRTNSGSFLISKERFSLSAGTPGSQTGRKEGLVSGAGANAAAWTGLALAPVSFAGGVIAIGLAVKLASDASVVNQSFKSKELQSSTLSPGKSLHGFVYFRLPKEAPLPEKLSLGVEAQLLPSKSTNLLEFTFETKSNKPMP